MDVPAKEAIAFLDFLLTRHNRASESINAPASTQSPVPTSGQQSTTSRASGSSQQVNSGTGQHNHPGGNQAGGNQTGGNQAGGNLAGGVGSTNNPGQPNVGQQGLSLGNPNPPMFTNKYFHWCVDCGQTFLHYINTSSSHRVKRGEDFVRELKRSYKQLRGLRWYLSLTDCATVKLVEVCNVFQKLPLDHETDLNNDANLPISLSV